MPGWNYVMQLYRLRAEILKWPVEISQSLIGELSLTFDFGFWHETNAFMMSAMAPVIGDLSRRHADLQNPFLTFANRPPRVLTRG